MKSELRCKMWVEVSQIKARRKRVLQAEVIACIMAWRESEDVPSSGLFSLAGIGIIHPGSEARTCVGFSLPIYDHWVDSLSQTQSELRDLEVLRRISVTEDWCVVWKKACMCTKERTHWRVEGQLGLDCVLWPWNPGNGKLTGTQEWGMHSHAPLFIPCSLPSSPSFWVLSYLRPMNI